MIIDPSSIHKNPNSKNNNPYDVAIIGSGPAGLTLCAELIESGKRICVIESGKSGKSALADSLRTVESTGEIIVKINSRERALGGTSTTWSGLSAPLDLIDFTQWPIPKTELIPYYDKASAYGFPKYEDFDLSTFDELRKTGDIQLPNYQTEEKIFIAGDPPWNFGKRMAYLYEHKDVDIFMNGTVTEIKKDIENTQKISSVIVQGKDFRKEIYAKVFVICAGGIESTRLLLVSDIGNENDQVGRKIMNHPKASHGTIILNKPIVKATHFFGFLQDGYARYAGIRLKESVQRELGLLNSYMRLEPMFPWTDSKGVASLIFIVKNASIPLNAWKKGQKSVVELKDYNETGDDSEIRDDNQIKTNWFKLLYSILSDFPAVFLYVIHRLSKNKEIKIKKIRIRNFMEMEARSDNRITLSDSKDFFGLPIPKLHLSTSELDRKSVIGLHKIFGEEIKKSNIGTLESNLENAKPWPIVADASHHLGGTCMGDDPKQSVVDKNLKVHSTSNLYISSGSVFPTSGCANPTYTICALSIRLAEHLKTNAF